MSKNDKAPQFLSDWYEKTLQNIPSDARKDVTVISHELLSGHPKGYDPDAALKTAENINNLFPDAKIFIVIRKQISYIESLYSYKVSVKGREHRSFNSFIKKVGAKGLFTHLEYHRLIQHYYQLFGQDKVTVLPIELLQVSPAEFFQKLGDLLKADLLGTEFSRAVNQSRRSLIVLTACRFANYFFGLYLRIRVSLSPEERKMETYNALRFIFNKERGKFIEKFGGLFEGKWNLDGRRNSQYKKEIRNFEVSNSKLSALTGLDLEKYGYPVQAES